MMTSSNLAEINVNFFKLLMSLSSIIFIPTFKVQYSGFIYFLWRICRDLSSLCKLYFPSWSTAQKVCLDIERSAGGPWTP